MMNQQSWNLLLEMTRLRKERSMAQSRRARSELDRVAGFQQQIQAYAREYDEQWLASVQAGTSVLTLQSQTAFGQKLHETARAQEPEVKALTQRLNLVKQQALRDHERHKALQAYIHKKKREHELHVEKREQRELEDLVALRKPSSV